MPWPGMHVPSKALRLILLNLSEAEKRYEPPYGAYPVARLRKATMEDSLRGTATQKDAWWTY